MPATIATLEKSITADIDAGKWNVDTAADLFAQYNLAKSYNKVLIIRLLARSLASFDSSDFDALYVQLPPNFTSTITEEVTALCELDSALHSAQFPLFWSSWEAKKALVGGAAPKFEEAVRSTIAQQLSRCVVSVADKDAAEALNVPAKELSKILAAYQATVAGGKVTFPHNETNNGGPAKKAGSVSLEQLVKLQQ
eukprot:GILI01005589.1.p1 GENE.GILI01005589.1~~GILI01005589.1.p1  ORF type:complete len:196 (-),score=70.71 GILI01005589.1:105-692(-)